MGVWNICTKLDAGDVISFKEMFDLQESIIISGFTLFI